MNEGFQPSAPPMERPKRGPKPGSKHGPRKTTNGNLEETTSVIDTLGIFSEISNRLAALPKQHRRSIMQALNDRFPV